jgi:hypothetical protein
VSNRLGAAAKKVFKL